MYLHVLQAYVAVRKGGKRLGVFDLTLELKWEGSRDAEEAAEGKDQEGEGGEKASNKVEGTLSISEFAQESDEDDWMIDCSTTATGEHAVRLSHLPLQLHS
jgi:hypothetical protein